MDVKLLDYESVLCNRSFSFNDLFVLPFSYSNLILLRRLQKTFHNSLSSYLLRITSATAIMTNQSYLIIPLNKSVSNSPHPSFLSIIPMPPQAKKNLLLRSSNPFLALWQIKRQSPPPKLLLHFSSVRFHQDLEIPSCFLS